MRNRVLSVGLLATLFSSFAFGQGTTSRLVGVVSDPSGAAVASVTVKLS